MKVFQIPHPLSAAWAQFYNDIRQPRYAPAPIISNGCCIWSWALFQDED